MYILIKGQVREIFVAGVFQQSIPFCTESTPKLFRSLLQNSHRFSNLKVVSPGSDNQQLGKIKFNLEDALDMDHLGLGLGLVSFLGTTFLSFRNTICKLSESSLKILESLRP
jgi:hypothetical protein